ncbi:MAG: hypothetical protein ACI3VA_09310 [Candidatus Limivicinus sp.]
MDKLERVCANQYKTFALEQSQLALKAKAFRLAALFSTHYNGNEKEAPAKILLRTGG